MLDNHGEAGLYAVALLALGLGGVHVLSGGLTLVSLGSAGAMIRAGSQAVLGLLLVPTGVALVFRKPWSRWVGVVAFGGIAVVQLLPLVTGTTFAVPLAGVLLATGCSLHLLLAGEAFETEADDRALTEDTNPHEFVR
ncbi:hypothetical protein AMS69_13525 [Haloarcula rubripromontorii]|uniref:Integral membrane protein n=1 Tax=Haloarcula rubripromontorii TaxID=1705562 RepID=A0A0M9AHZ8_9EURY|nr:hypothetical protein [Haloarcula rubripromontorii]KOX92389.1 hypothetical protein AMS69_13525 [Haloarcula rubripromontorii]